MYKNRSLPIIFAIGHAVKPTGLARVFNSLFTEICNDYFIIQFGLNYYGAPVMHANWIIEPNQILGDTSGSKQLPNLLNRYKPDLIFICYEHGLWQQLYPILVDYYYGSFFPKVIFYCPIDYLPSQPHSFGLLSKVDHLVAYTEFGSRVIRDSLLHCLCQIPKMSIIPHGVDMKKFYPLEGIDNVADNHRVARRIVFPDRLDLDNAFIVLNANRNAPRKRVDLTLNAFADFVRDKPSNVFLYLHMGMQDMGYRVIERAISLGITDRLLVTTMQSAMPNVSDFYLNLIYNACDVGINTSLGEGWGLVSFEHAATGALQIVPNHTACAELWQGNGICVKVHDDDINSDLLNTAVHSEIVRALNNAYTGMDNIAHLGFHMATNPKYNWSNIALQWKGLINSLLN